MATHDLLSTRIRSEYQAMPGMSLTLPQACRLWQVNPADCATALNGLVANGFLTRTDEGTFIATASATSRRMTSADLPPTAARRSA